MKSFRILVTSSRTWPDESFVWDVLDTVAGEAPAIPVIVTHGDCPTGGDRFARNWARGTTPHAQDDPHPADWDRLGKQAGFVRNEAMVDLKPQLCLAFLQPCVKKDCPHGPEEHDSHGTTHTIGLCEYEKIPTVVFRADRDGRLLTPIA
jgi:hypothetical protein